MKRKAWLEIIACMVLISLCSKLIGGLVLLFIDLPEPMTIKYLMMMGFIGLAIRLFFTILLMRRLSGIRGYKMGYWKSAGICILVGVSEPFISWLFMWVLYHDVIDMQKEWKTLKLLILNPAHILTVLAACIIAAFFTKNRYKPPHTDILDEQETGI